MPEKYIDVNGYAQALAQGSMARTISAVVAGRERAEAALLDRRNLADEAVEAALWEEADLECAAGLLRELRLAGIQVEAMGDQLYVKPQRLLTEGQREAIREHKAELLTLLRERIPESIAYELVTPAQAREWLGYNTHNRPRSSPEVQHLAAAMRRGEWQPTNQGIGFDWHGTLIDGQHRLEAIVLAGVTVKLAVARGLPPAAQEVIDKGRKRTLGNGLHLSGYTNADELAATTQWLLRHEAQQLYFSRKMPYTQVQIEAYLDAHPEVPAYLTETLSTVRKTPLTPALTLALGAIFRRIDTAKADDFITKLSLGTNIDQGHPCYALRDALRAGKITGARGDRPQRIALTVVAWNAYYQGRSLRWVKLATRAAGNNADGTERREAIWPEIAGLPRK